MLINNTAIILFSYKYYDEILKIGNQALGIVRGVKYAQRWQFAWYIHFLHEELNKLDGGETTPGRSWKANNNK